jgi:hypothetical protein
LENSFKTLDELLAASNELSSSPVIEQYTLQLAKLFGEQRSLASLTSSMV